MDFVLSSRLSGWSTLCVQCLCHLEGRYDNPQQVREKHSSNNETRDKVFIITSDGNLWNDTVNDWIWPVM